MREMKNSGIAWIGEIPIQWSSIKIKYYCDNIFAGGTPQSTQEEYWDGPIKWIPSGSCHNKKIYFAPKSITQKGFENSSTKLIPANTALVAMTGATCGNTGYLTFDSCANQSVTAYVENKRICNSIYLWYAVQAAKEHLLTFQTGGAQGGVNVENCKNIYLPYVSLEEQNNIAEYLEYKTQIVEEAIANQEAQIEKLKQYKQSLITEVVTKGLNPDAEMKDSGVEWIGEIPSHWSVVRGKAVLENLSRKVGPEMEVITCFRDGEVTLRKNRREEGFTFSDKEIGYQGIYPGDLVIHGMDGFAGAIGISDSKGKGSPILIVCDSKENKNYLMYYLRNLAYRDIFLALSTGIRVRSCDLRWNKLSVLPFVVPPHKEQEEIIEYLNNKCNQIDKLIEIKQSKIAKLNEYKKSLIYEYVTGKKEVC